MIDAHNHLHDARLAPWREEILRELPRIGVRWAVVNGTRESDWPEVAALAAEQAWVKPSFGLHPWHVKERTPDWIENLQRQLDAHPGCGVGEIGLDRWVEGHDLEDQLTCFRAQMQIATERNLPVTIHCLRAWGALLDEIRNGPVPARGFLVHAFGGEWEVAAGLMRKKGYLSFSTAFLHERKAARREMFVKLPLERVLVETDAPDMAPPSEYRNLIDRAGETLNDPANIEVAYAALAKLRKMTVAALREQVAENFGRWWGLSG